MRIQSSPVTFPAAANLPSRYKSPVLFGQDDFHPRARARSFSVRRVGERSTIEAVYMSLAENVDIDATLPNVASFLSREAGIPVVIADRNQESQPEKERPNVQMQKETYKGNQCIKVSFDTDKLSPQLVKNVLKQLVAATYLMTGNVLYTGQLSKENRDFAESVTPPLPSRSDILVLFEEDGDGSDYVGGHAIWGNSHRPPVQVVIDDSGEHPGTPAGQAVIDAILRRMGFQISKE